MERKQTFPGEFLAWLFILVLAVIALTGCLPAPDISAEAETFREAGQLVETTFSVLK